MIWLLLAVSAVGIAVFIERLLHYHRAQINSAEFINGVRNVLKRDNVVEALSICDATPGPVPRLVTVALGANPGEPLDAPTDFSVHVADIGTVVVSAQVGAACRRQSRMSR